MKFDELLGAVGLASMSVRPGDTSVAMGLNDLSTASSIAFLNVIESACSAAVIDLLEISETTQTVKFQLEISTTVSAGEELVANARCIEVNGDLFTFECEVMHLGRTIATALLQRRLVDRVTYMARIAAERIASN